MKGLCNIADVLIYGCGTIQEETEKDHNENLQFPAANATSETQAESSQIEV